MEQLQHFSHKHPVGLIQFQPHHNNENSDKEGEDEVKDDIVVEEGHVGKCDMCEEEIYSFHLCYYCGKDCTTMSEQKMDQPSHPHQMQRYLVGRYLVVMPVVMNIAGTFTIVPLVHRSGSIYTALCFRRDKCRYYAHVDCATTRKEPFMSSILMQAGSGKTCKDDDHPNLIRCPFPDESVNLLMHHFINKGELVIKRNIDGEIFCHPHFLMAQFLSMIP